MNRLSKTNPLRLVSESSCKYPASRQAGIILIIVLFLILILGVVIFQFGLFVKYEKNIAENRVNSLKASYSIQSKLEMAKLAILNDKILSSLQSRPKSEEILDTEEIPQDTSLPGITITDAASRLNINYIVDAKGRVNNGIKQAVENLIVNISGNLAIAGTIIDNIIDCIDKDTKSQGGGQENRDYNNRPFQNITELGIIEEITGELLMRSSKDDPPKLYDLLTVFSSGRININTAPRELLIAIAANSTYEKAVSNIIEQREIKPFKSASEIYQISGVSRGIFGYFENRLTTVPSVFIVDIEVTEGKITSRARAVYKKQGKTVNMIFFQKE